MNPSHKDQIIKKLGDMQLAQKRPVEPWQMESFIKGKGYKDPARELRRLYEDGMIEKYSEGKYGTSRTRRPNSLELFA